MLAAVGRVLRELDAVADADSGMPVLPPVALNVVVLPAVRGPEAPTPV